MYQNLGSTLEFDSYDLDSSIFNGPELVNHVIFKTSPNRVNIQDLYNKNQAFHPNIILDFQSGQAAFKQGKIVFGNNINVPTKIATDTIIGCGDVIMSTLGDSVSIINSQSTGLIVSNDGVKISIDGSVKSIEGYVKEIIREASTTISTDITKKAIRITLNGSPISLEKDSWSNESENTVVNDSEDVLVKTLNECNKIKVFYTNNVDEYGRPQFGSNRPVVDFTLSSLKNPNEYNASVPINQAGDHYILIITDYAVVERVSEVKSNLMEVKGTVNVDNLRKMRTKSAEASPISMEDMLRAGITNIVSTNVSYTIDSAMYPNASGEATLIKISTTDGVLQDTNLPVHIIEDENRNYLGELDLSINSSVSTLLPINVDSSIINLRLYNA